MLTRADACVTWAADDNNRKQALQRWINGMSTHLCVQGQAVVQRAQPLSQAGDRSARCCVEGDASEHSISIVFLPAQYSQLDGPSLVRVALPLTTAICV
jgi:hypothetical protein